MNGTRICCGCVDRSSDKAASKGVESSEMHCRSRSAASSVLLMARSCEGRRGCGSKVRVRRVGCEGQGALHLAKKSGSPRLGRRRIGIRRPFSTRLEHEPFLASEAQPRSSTSICPAPLGTSTAASPRVIVTSRHFSNVVDRGQDGRRPVLARRGRRRDG